METFTRLSLTRLAFASVLAGFAVGGIAHAQAVTDEWASVKAPSSPPALKAVTLDPKKTALLVMDF